MLPGFTTPEAKALLPLFFSYAAQVRANHSVNLYRTPLFLQDRREVEGHYRRHRGPVGGGGRHWVRC